MTDTLSFDEIKAKQQKVWSSGDYGKIAWITVPLADTLVEAADIRPGARVLDVATGTGHVALAAARRFCEVTGIDYVPALVESARRRAEAEALDIDFREADAENLPFDDDSFDYVFSAIGVMFTADHQRAADELVRVARPGGRVAVASWTPTGFIGQLLKTVSRHAAPPPGAMPPTRWGTAETMRELLGDRVSSLNTTTATVAQRFPSAEHFADFFLTHYGPTHAAAGRLDDDGKRAFRDDLIALATTSNRSTDGTLVSDWEYLVVVADKA
ncbi:class I SAM-dependent methyltransferase [Actinokineospora sp. HUAS TT18]|uniref:class I SAM-dependent methyltransferase n=1 Tax=Actinokineospora sp. HUAS TT18 TaxID=3447451 RepID=UPI003F51E45A